MYKYACIKFTYLNEECKNNEDNGWIDSHYMKMIEYCCIASPRFDDTNG